MNRDPAFQTVRGLLDRELIKERCPLIGFELVCPFIEELPSDPACVRPLGHKSTFTVADNDVD